MTYRDLFNDAEWQTLTFAPLWSFSAVAASDGTIDPEETSELTKELTEAPLLKAALAREVFVTLAMDLATILPAYQADTRNVFVGLRDAANLLKRVDANQAAMFKFAIMSVGSKVAATSGPTDSKISNEEAQAWAMAGAVLGFDQKESEAAFKTL